MEKRTSIISIAAMALVLVTALGACGKDDNPVAPCIRFDPVTGECLDYEDDGQCTLSVATIVYSQIEGGDTWQFWITRANGAIDTQTTWTLVLDNVPVGGASAGVRSKRITEAGEHTVYGSGPCVLTVPVTFTVSQ